MKKHKYIFVIGGVMSGVGKGISAASIGAILKARGFKISSLKIDPYINVDAGTMNPTEHGEVFVLDSGLECDQDMGNYERFLNVTLPPENYMTTGMVYKSVIDRERNLEYHGKCVEVMHHIPEEIMQRIELSIKNTKADISIIEIGGTAGDYQNVLFFEAARILRLKNPGDVAVVLVSYLPVPSKIGEMKTKPTQHAVSFLNASGINADVIIARSDHELDDKRKEKLAYTSNLSADRIISAPDVSSVYEVPIRFADAGLDDTLLKLLGLTSKKRDLVSWKKAVAKIKKPDGELKIGLLGKYFKTGDFVLSDVYISVIESIKHAAYTLGRIPKIDWIDSESYEKNPEKLEELDTYDALIVPGGFGSRGVAGIILGIEYARKNKIPYLGLCYGMQLAVVEYARNVVGLKGAHTHEVDPKTKYPVVDTMPDQVDLIKNKKLGGTMRLGRYDAVLAKGTRAAAAYGSLKVTERHRHRYEVNPVYIDQLEEKGLVFSGKSPDGRLMEILELPEDVHPFFMASQFHPEFTSRFLNPNPLFLACMKAALERHKKANRV